MNEDINMILILSKKSKFVKTNLNIEMTVFWKFWKTVEKSILKFEGL